eukprot:scaffold30240_cov62-Phaeocystis_antarctica.AAC.1
MQETVSATSTVKTVTSHPGCSVPSAASSSSTRSPSSMPSCDCSHPSTWRVWASSPTPASLPGRR